MDLQQQQTGIASTDNPQAGTANLQQTSSTNVNQLSVNELSVTSTCTTACSGSIPPQTVVNSSGGIAGGTWLAMAVGVIVVAIVAWMFRKLSAGPFLVK